MIKAFKWSRALEKTSNNAIILGAQVILNQRIFAFGKVHYVKFVSHEQLVRGLEVQ